MTVSCDLRPPKIELLPGGEGGEREGITVRHGAEDVDELQTKINYESKASSVQ
jgi:hypothetical protein